VEARPPAEKTQPPTPPPARPVAQESPGQQLVRMAFGVKGPPTPSQFNGSVTGMEVDDTRANQTYHSNDETEPLSMSQGQKIVHALSTKIHMSDLARRQNVGLNELSGRIISPVQLENSNRDEFSSPVGMHRDFSLLRAGRACGVPQFQLPQRTPGQTRQARGGRRGPPGGARAGPGAHCGVGPAWVLEIISNQKPSPMSCPAHRIGLSSLSNAKVVLAPPCAPLRAQPPPAAGRATPWSGPPCDRPPQSASVEEASRSA
jgi:hypothetical protein